MTGALASAIPPQTVDDLRTWIEEAARDDASGRIGRRALKLLSNMVDAPNQTAVSSISDIARANRVNASTVTRLAQRLGYQGFAELQDVFRRHVADGHRFYSRQAGRLLNARKGAGGSAALLDDIARDEMANVAATLDRIGKAELENAVKALATARQVRVLGLRQCFSAAHFLGYGLSLIRGGVAVLGSPGHTLPEQVAELDGKSVLVVISFAPYTVDSVVACHSARAQGAQVIAISDSSASPVAAGAGAAFAVSTEGPFFFNAMAATLILAEVLLALVAQRLGERAVAELRRRERLFERFHTETE